MTIVRRYVDAQKHFIGELYEGEGRTARMIGMSCDSLPFTIEHAQPSALQCFCEFTAPMKANRIRVGGQEPTDNAHVWKHVARWRFCIVRITVLNRFIERVMESDCAR